MLKLDISNFIKSLSALEAYVPPIEGKKGVKYLYENLYLPLEKDAEVRIDSIDLDAFTLEELGEFEDYFDFVLNRHKCDTYNMRGSLSKLTPAVSKIQFI